MSVHIPTLSSPSLFSAGKLAGCFCLFPVFLKQSQIIVLLAQGSWESNAVIEGNSSFLHGLSAQLIMFLLLSLPSLGQ